MTDQDLYDYYSGLLIIQYANLPKAVGTIQASVKGIIMNQLPLAVQDGFDLDTAIGKQLDIAGKYIGVSRQGNSFTGPVTLDDDDYRTLLKIKTVENAAGSSLYDIQVILNNNFPGTIKVFDYADMSLDYFFDSVIGSETLAEVFIRDGLLPKPMAVGLRALIYSPDIDNFFGFRTYTSPAVDAKPFNQYANGFNPDWKWLSYKNAIVE